MSTYMQGNTVSLTCEVTTAPGSFIDPGTIALTVKLPNATITDISSAIVRDSSGHYSAQYLPDAAGDYAYKWMCSGSVQAAAAGAFTIAALPF